MRHLLISLVLCLSAVQSANAEQLLETYVAKLVTQDHFNSKGIRLTNAAAIIRQDRANFHKFGKADEQDEWDSFFSRKANRARLERMLRNGVASKATLKQIVNSTPTIVVYIYPSSITVEVL